MKTEKFFCTTLYLLSISLISGESIERNWQETQMNPHENSSISPLKLLRSLVTHQDLIIGLIRREIVGRYRGSMMGLLWSFFNPVLMLAVYTFVFGVVFGVRWSGEEGTKSEFAIILFSGLIAFNLFSETINRSPSLILSNVNYVKRVVFPLEILPMVIVGSACFHYVISLVVWLGFFVLISGWPPLTFFILPFVLLPLVLFSLGAAWFLASLGVFLRDITHVTGVLTVVIMYMTPIFYPISAVPTEYRSWLNVNPLASGVEQIRNAMMWGGVDYAALAWQMVFGLIFAWLGYAWFQKTRRGFADVV